MPRIDIHAAYDTARTQAHYHMVVAAAAAAAAFPAVHPFAVLVELVRDKDWFAVLQQPFLGCKKIIAARKRLAAQAR